MPSWRRALKRLNNARLGIRKQDNRESVYVVAGAKGGWYEKLFADIPARGPDRRLSLMRWSDVISVIVLVFATTFKETSFAYPTGAVRCW